MKWLEEKDRVRDIMGRQLRVPFREKRLRFGDGRDSRVWWCAVSDDDAIYARIVAHNKPNAVLTNRQLETRVARALMHCRYLELCVAKRKLIIFTNKELWLHFNKVADGLLIDVRGTRVETVWANLEGNCLVFR